MILRFEPGGVTKEFYVYGTERIAMIVPNTLGITPSRIQFNEATYFLTDHLGNTRVAYMATTTTNHDAYIINEVEEFAFANEDEMATNVRAKAMRYYPYGKVLREYDNGAGDHYMTTQHERDRETGLDYRGARYYDSDVARFLSTDPWANKYPAWSTYNYVIGNPVKFVDPTGKGPGDLFATPDEAANDWGATYAAKSIRQNLEYGSVIYKVEKDGKVFYTYTKAKMGDKKGTNTSKNPEGTEVVADIHSHAAYDKELDNTDGHNPKAQKTDANNEFSVDDEESNHTDKIDGYLTTPNGSLLFNKYVENIFEYMNTPKRVVNTDQPSDPNDPSRKNNISPKNKKNENTPKKDPNEGTTNFNFFPIVQF